MKKRDDKVNPKSREEIKEKWKNRMDANGRRGEKW